MGDEFGLPLDDSVEQGAVRIFFLLGIGMVAGNDIVGENPQILFVLPLLALRGPPIAVGTRRWYASVC